VELRKKVSMAVCDTCAYLVYDEEYDEDICTMNLDEDDLARFYSSDAKQCPYYRNGDEYAVVRHQAT
jgi:hypothetical protein